MKTSLIVLVLFLFILYILYVYKNRGWKKSLQKVNEDRPKLSRDQYINFLIEKGFEREHIEVVYHEIRIF